MIRIMGKINKREKINEKLYGKKRLVAAAKIW